MAMEIRRIWSSGSLPVSIADLKLDLRVDSDDEDDALDRMARGAAGFLERRTGFVLIPGRYETWGPPPAQLQWPTFQPMPWEIMRGPLRELEQISYRNSASTFADLAISDFIVQEQSRSFLIGAPNGFNWPTDIYYSNPLPNFRVRFMAGFDTVDLDSGVSGEEHPLDDGMRTCFLALCAHFYQNRELLAADKVAEIEAGAGSLLGAYRQFW
jgi:uncharacterized phiE125 gp8 family phage protein